MSQEKSSRDTVIHIFGKLLPELKAAATKKGMLSTARMDGFRKTQKKVTDTFAKLSVFGEEILFDLLAKPECFLCLSQLENSIQKLVETYKQIYKTGFFKRSLPHVVISHNQTINAATTNLNIKCGELVSSVQENNKGEIPSAPRNHFHLLTGDLSDRPFSFTSPHPFSLSANSMGLIVCTLQPSPKLFQFSGSDRTPNIDFPISLENKNENENSGFCCVFTTESSHVTYLCCANGQSVHAFSDTMLPMQKYVMPPPPPPPEVCPKPETQFSSSSSSSADSKTEISSLADSVEPKNQKRKVQKSSKPVSVIVHEYQQKLFVCDNEHNRICVFDEASAEFLSQIRMSFLISPTSIAFDPESGVLFVASQGNSEIQMFSLDGEHLGSLGHPPCGGASEISKNSTKLIVFDPNDGFLFLWDEELHRIFVHRKMAGWMGSFVPKGVEAISALSVSHELGILYACGRVRDSDGPKWTICAFELSRTRRIQRRNDFAFDEDFL